jgi:hypothetical protein
MATLTLTIPTADIDRIKEATGESDAAGVKQFLIRILKNHVRNYELDQAALAAALDNLDVT